MFANWEDIRCRLTLTHICGTAKTNGPRVHVSTRTYARAHAYPWCKAIDEAWGSRLRSLTTQQGLEKKKTIKVLASFISLSCPHWLLHFLIVLLKQKNTHTPSVISFLLFFTRSKKPSSALIGTRHSSQITVVTQLLFLYYPIFVLLKCKKFLVKSSFREPNTSEIFGGSMKGWHFNGPPHWKTAKTVTSV